MTYPRQRLAQSPSLPPLNILAVSDKVLESHHSIDVRHRYPNVDLLVGCGDLPYYYLDFLVSALDTPMVYVLGNHDAGRQYSLARGELKGVRGGTNIHGRCVNKQGVLIAGLEGSMRYRPNRTQQYSQSEMWRNVVRLFPKLLMNRIRHGRYLDMLVAHSPPAGIHDKADLTHQGFNSFLTLMRLFRPRYLLHGHIHHNQQQNRPISQYLDTSIINVYPNYYFQLADISASEIS